MDQVRGVWFQTLNGIVVRLCARPRRRSSGGWTRWAEDESGRLLALVLACGVGKAAFQPEVELVDQVGGVWFWTLDGICAGL